LPGGHSLEKAGQKRTRVAAGSVEMGCVVRGVGRSLTFGVAARGVVAAIGLDLLAW
jgi:hypothetical protein